MCGIAGLFELDGRAVNASVVEQMCASLEHRGPDAGGLTQPDIDIVLGHRRLSIIDVEAGNQPMCNEDGSVWITFNGEIFNFPELRDELLARGHIFKTRSDTEVIVHLYEDMGPSCVERLNGQFAFAIYDGDLFCARDPIGIKPFYYYFDGTRFAFASEPRAFFALPDTDMSIDHEALLLYMQYQYIPSPHSSYRNVRKLRPGEHIIVSRKNKIKCQRYGDLTTRITEDLDDLDSNRQMLRDTFSAAVHRQMISDFSVGAFLSGGIDSSSVLAFAQTHTQNRVKSFTIGFPEKDERAYAREVAEWVGSESIESEFGHSAARQVMPELLDHIDEPLGDTSLLPTYAVSLLARKHTPVVLSGDGGDELFAGYGRYTRTMRFLSSNPLFRRYWSIMGRLSGPSLKIEDWDNLDSGSCRKWPDRILEEMTDPRGATLYGPILRDAMRHNISDPVRDEIHRHRHLPPLVQLLAIDLQTNLPDRLLAKVDRASMKTSLEVRVPFLDLELLRLGLRLKPTIRLHQGRHKGIIREISGNLLPQTVFERKKKGFGAPVKYWFARDLSSYVEERLADSIGVKEGLLNQHAISALLKPRYNRKVNGPRVWRVLVLENWLRGVHDGRFKPSKGRCERLPRFNKTSFSPR